MWLVNELVYNGFINFIYFKIVPCTVIKIKAVLETFLFIENDRVESFKRMSNNLCTYLLSQVVGKCQMHFITFEILLKNS